MATPTSDDIAPRVDQFRADAVLPRHGHRQGYASVVLAGSFTEASFFGLVRAVPGDVLLHGNFDSHANSGDGGRRNIRILRLPWSDDQVEGHYRVGDPEELVRVAERDPQAAVQMLTAELSPAPQADPHWANGLAEALRGEAPLRLQDWAARIGARPEALSRGFRRHFGASPKLYRLEARSRRAWQRVVRSNQSLTAIAHEYGFADLAHFSRSVRALTGASPSAWRASTRAQASALR